MANTPKIKSFKKVVPMIYAYNTPGVAYHEGWTKVGYTEKQSVDKRIKQQTHTADIKYVLAWQDNAMYKDGSGEYFTDHDFHAFLELDCEVERTPGTEWFNERADVLRTYFDKFARRETFQKEEDKFEYALRDEQKQAVEMTKSYFENGGKEFLWNAKPRFGKTLTTYDLIRQMGFQNVLIVTNRPSIANSWAEDFHKFIGWRGELSFVSETDALRGKPGVISREGYLKAMSSRVEEASFGMVAFESLQGLKGSVYFGGKYDKLAWMAKEYSDQYGKKQHGMQFDLLVIDEAQEGVDTMRTDRAFRNIARKHTLYLSGTPFKAIASEQFARDQIYNWSYADEQERKDNWDGEDNNPYEALPRLAMYTYQLSPMIRERLEKGLDLSEEEGAVDPAFDLNEFLRTNDSGKFIREDEIKKFLHALVTQEKYPFSTEKLRDELSHTLWILNRVSSAKALAKLLNDDPVFGEYKIVLAAGDGKLMEEEDSEAAFDRVKAAIANNDKTITISVGQLTVGVTIPEWSGVLMLCNMKSPSSYMQAAFRAQNPCILTKNGQRYRKETAYVFDFDPARTLIIFDEFANNLQPETVRGQGTTDDRKDNIRRLLNFFPVIGEDTEGKMVELDASSVLSIPRALKSAEVVRKGFMCNFLFRNISNVFGAPSIVREIVEKLTPAAEVQQKKRDNSVLDGMNNVSVNDDGEVKVDNEIVIGKTQDLFGEKIYEEFTDSIQSQVTAISENTDPNGVDEKLDTLVSSIKEGIKDRVVAPVVNEYSVKKNTQNRLERQVEHEIDNTFEKVKKDYKQQARIAQAEFEREQKEAQDPQEVRQAEDKYKAVMEDAMKAFTEAVQQSVKKTIEEKPQELVEQLEKAQAEQEKRTVEDEVRAHLRGFSRTIPSFIMAYGDGHLTLANFDDYTEDDVFLEVTGITEDDFRFLRDGGDYEDPDTGEVQHFDGHLFDEVVFNDSIEEFWKKKQELADYFDESKDEDIFDYIPPQKTNQIFTPRWVVEKMVDQLEENNPGCFDDPTKTYADLYMKSGLYITEIVKRLYRSEGMKKAIPDDKERIRHILSKQVYGMAPTRIIYLIATNYILGFDEELKADTHNFVEADAAKASKNDTLEALVNDCFG